MEKAGDEASRRRWLVQWFLQHPDKNTFAKAVDAWPEAEDVDTAWDKFTVASERFDPDEPLVSRVLKEMATAKASKAISRSGPLVAGLSNRTYPT